MQTRIYLFIYLTFHFHFTGKKGRKSRSSKFVRQVINIDAQQTATPVEATTSTTGEQPTFALEYDIGDHTAIGQQTNVIPMIVTSDTNDQNFVTMELAYQTA